MCSVNCIWSFNLQFNTFFPQIQVINLNASKLDLTFNVFDVVVFKVACSTGVFNLWQLVFKCIDMLCFETYLSQVQFILSGSGVHNELVLLDVLFINELLHLLLNASKSNLNDVLIIIKLIKYSMYL